MNRITSIGSIIVATLFGIVIGMFIMKQIYHLGYKYHWGDPIEIMWVSNSHPKYTYMMCDTLGNTKLSDGTIGIPIICLGNN